MILSFRGGLKRYLVLLVLAALLPMLVWSAGLLWWNSLQERRAIELGLTETARALTAAVDRELELSIEGLVSISLSSTLQSRNYAAFANVLHVLSAQHQGWISASLIDADGRHIFNTQYPFGTNLPTIAEYGDSEFAATFKRVTETGQPVVSDLFVGKVAQRPIIAVAVPVFDAGGVVTHVLAAGLLPERLADLLGQQGPPGWLSGVTDRRDVIVARSVGHDQFLGREAFAWWREAVAGRSEGITSGRALHGALFTFAFRRSSLTGWIIFFGAPREMFTRTLSKSMAVTAGFGVLVTAGSVLLALAVARRIITPVGALTAAASPFVRKGKEEGQQYAITELDDLHRALDGLAGDLASSRRRFQKVFSVAPVMLFVCDAECRLTDVNDSWLKTLGYERDEVLGMLPLDFHTPENRAHFLDNVWPRFLAAGAIDDIPAQYATRAGEVRDVLISLRGEYGDGDSIVRTIGAIRDVTEERRAELALTRAVDEAAKANAAKTRFLAAASHDLRQPLQALSLYLGVLQASREGDEAVMTAARQCVDSLSGLLNDMLDVARLDSGTITPRQTLVPVAQLMEHAAAAWAIQAEAKGLRLSFHSCGAIAWTDPALMERVLSNLIGNAVRYTERGRIVVGCRRAGFGKVRIEVWDTGVGIPAEKLGEIFEEFRQLDNVERRRDKGTGLGLSIVQRICDLLGHRLQVRSWSGRGSVFSITVETSESCLVPEPAQVEGDRPARRRILVVDDEAHVRQALGMVLSNMGHDVVMVETMEEALASVDARSPQLVIVDFRLRGGLTGIQVAAAVRERMKVEVPALVLTGDTDPATMRAIGDAGLHLLHKPLRVDALKTFLRQVA